MSKIYCGCGKRSFKFESEAKRYKLKELYKRGSKKKSHVYQCSVSHDYHITYKEA